MSQRFTISDTFTLGTGQSLQFLGITDANINVTFDPITVDSDQPNVIVELYENTVTTSDGTELEPIAVNRKLVAPNSCLAFSNPVVSNAGDRLFKFATIGPKHGGIGSQFRTVFTLKNNTKYLYKITNNSNQSANISVNMTWDEHIQHRGTL